MTWGGRFAPMGCVSASTRAELAPGARAVHVDLRAFRTRRAWHMSQALGCIAMTAVAMPTTSVSIGGLADAFGHLCDQALSIGFDVQLELIPMTVVRDIATAWQIIQAADRANSGLVFDTWHFYRENPDFSALRQIPGHRIAAVQGSDANATVRGDMRADANTGSCRAKAPST